MSKEELQAKIAWGVTGAGHFLLPCLELILSSKQTDVFLSKAAQEVLRSYGYSQMLESAENKLILDTSASSKSISGLYTGKYHSLVIAPVTSNSIAKMVHGIADNLITNLFAHAGKCRIPIYLLPCDCIPEIQSMAPQGNKVSLSVREIDHMNIEKLGNWHGVQVAKDPEELRKMINSFNQ